MHPSSVGAGSTKRLLGRACEQTYRVDTVTEDRKRSLPGFLADAIEWPGWESATEAGTSIANSVAATWPPSSQIVARTRMPQSLRTSEHADASRREKR